MAGFKIVTTTLYYTYAFANFQQQIAAMRAAHAFVVKMVIHV